MSQTITLELPDDVMEKINQAANSSGKSIEATLQKWIIQSATAADTMLMLQQASALPIYTPQGGEQTAQELLAYGQRIQSERNTSPRTDPK